MELADPMNIAFVVIFGLLAIGMVLLIYGTIAKNRWGINTNPVFCPRCNTPFPRIRQPENIRQALWGGGRCAKCGTEVDKWGRELVAQKESYPIAGVLQAEGRSGRAFKRRFIVIAAVFSFGLTLFFDWFGLAGHPSTLGGWLVFAGSAAIETAIFTVLFYFASMYLLNRLFFKERAHGAVEGHEPQHDTRPT